MQLGSYEINRQKVDNLVSYFLTDIEADPLVGLSLKETYGFTTMTSLR